MKKTLLMMLLASGFLMNSACSTITFLGPGSGKAIKVEGVSYSKLWKISNKILAQQMTIVTSDEQSGILKAEKRAGTWTHGEVIGVFISPAKENAPSYVIEVVSKKRLKIQFFTGQNWEETVIGGIKAEL